MGKIKWINNLDNLLQIGTHYYDGQTIIKIYKYKQDHPILLLTYFFKITDKIVDLELIKQKLNDYQGIKSKHVLKIHYAATISNKFGHFLVLIHEEETILMLSTHLSKQWRNVNCIVQAMMELLKGMNKLRLANIIHNQIKSYNIFWNGRHVLLGLPSLTSILKKNDMSELNQDILSFADYLCESIQKQQISSQIPACQKQTYKQSINTLKDLANRMKNNNMETLEVFRELKRIKSMKINRLVMKFDIFKRSQKQQVYHKQWKGISQIKVQDHFLVAIAYDEKEIKIEVTSNIIKQLKFYTSVQLHMIDVPYIDSIGTFYNYLISHKCSIIIARTTQISFYFQQEFQRQPYQPNLAQHKKQNGLTKQKFEIIHRQSKYMWNMIQHQDQFEDPIQFIVKNLENIVSFNHSNNNKRHLEQKMKKQLLQLLQQHSKPLSKSFSNKVKEKLKRIEGIQSKQPS